VEVENVAVQEQDQDEQTNEETEGQGGGNRATAMKAAAAAAATGVAAVAAKKAFSGRGHGDRNSGKDGGSPEKGEGESLLSSMLSGGWEAARDSLLPMAEDAAAAAGEFLAENGPDVVRERIVPRFIQSFNEAGGGG
jgi:hypothetical protein